MKVLVSAFTPFNKAINNYSLEVLNYLENIDKIVVDVIYDNCYQELKNKFNLDDYDLIIALGEARSRKVLTLETKAYNLASCSLPDNANILNKQKYKENTHVQFYTDAILKELQLSREIQEASLAIQT